jgi:NADPH:quinone reductase-like Zn-dependent oxidoreductase
LDSTTARQFWVRSPGKGEIVTVDLPPMQEGEVAVRTLFSGVSRGTEAMVFRGEVPESQFEVMRSPFQDGEFPAPVKYGYSSVGEVIDGPTELIGEVVFCLHPHQDIYCVPTAAVHCLPVGLPAERAVLAANAETALNAIWDATPGPGDRIVVIGGGVIGLLAAWICEGIPGTDVTLFDTNVNRASVAERLGLSFVSAPPTDANADLVIHASGSPAGLQCALGVAGVEATIIDVSWYGTKTVPLALGEAFHSRRLTIRSSQVGRIPPHRSPRWDFRRRMRSALDLLSDPRLDILVSHESDFETLPDIMLGLSKNSTDVLCHRVRYPRD